MNALKEFKVDKLTVKKFATRQDMGDCAGQEIICKIRELLETQEEVNMIFAAAPSQNEVLAQLIGEQGLPWDRINAFHMDEYIGLSQDAPQRFGNFLKEHIFDKLNFKSVNYINGDGDVQQECKRYAQLLSSRTIDIVCMGIGENGHIAFNDPGVADFNDTEVIKAVTLDEKCRNQQVNDGCFQELSQVPKQALTLTVPTLMKGRYLFCSVPAKTKAEAVKNTVSAPISEDCPATVLRTHDNAVLYCDSDSGAYI